MVRAFTHGAMGCQIDPVRLILCGGPIELFLVPASAPRLVTKAVACDILSVGWYNKSSPVVVAAGFLSRCTHGRFTLRLIEVKHITVNKMCSVHH